jgi:hypothetical protein
MSAKKKTTWIDEAAKEGDLVLTLPMVKPATEVPVVELFVR